MGLILKASTRPNKLSVSGGRTGAYKELYGLRLRLSIAVVSKQGQTKGGKKMQYNAAEQWHLFNRDLADLESDEELLITVGTRKFVIKEAAAEDLKNHGLEESICGETSEKTLIQRASNLI